MRFARHARVEQDEIERTDRVQRIERPGRLRVTALGQRCAHQLAAVVIAGNGGKTNLERREEPVEMLVLLGHRRIGKVTGYHHELWSRPEGIERGDASRKRGRSVDLAIGQHARTLDMQIGNLGDQEGRAHASPFGKSRIAEGSTESPTRSPAFTINVFGTSTIIVRSAAPLTLRRWRSPTKLTLVTSPVRLAFPAATMAIDSGRTMASAGPSTLVFSIASRPPRKVSVPELLTPSRMLAAPTNSATKRLAGAK